jgi:hypothetical protein
MINRLRNIHRHTCCLFCRMYHKHDTVIDSLELSPNSIEMKLQFFICKYSSSYDDDDEFLIQIKFIVPVLS